MGQNHVRLLSAHRRSSSRPLADPAEASLEDAVRQTGAVGYADALEMLDDAQLDAVVIATPTTFHAAIALAAIERGIPVLVEKPLAATVEEGSEILAPSRRRGVPIQVGHVERFNPAVRELDRLPARAGSRRSTRSRAPGWAVSCTDPRRRRDGRPRDA